MRLHDGCGYQSFQSEGEKYFSGKCRQAGTLRRNAEAEPACSQTRQITYAGRVYERRIYSARNRISSDNPAGDVAC
jgi:hypothetical protein